MSKALIRDVDNTIEAFEVQFNPNSLEYSVGTNYRSTKGSKKTNGKSTLADDESAQSDPSGKTGSASLSVTLFYHTYTDEDTYAFENVDTTLRTLIRQEVIAALRKWEPRIFNIQVTFEQNLQEGALLVNISYEILRTGASAQISVPLNIL